VATPRLIGREAERRALDAPVADPGGARSVLVLRGEPGIGRSALLAHAVVAARARALRVLVVEGLETGTTLPYAPCTSSCGRSWPAPPPCPSRAGRRSTSRSASTARRRRARSWQWRYHTRSPTRSPRTRRAAVRAAAHPRRRVGHLGNLFAGIQHGHQDNWADYHNADRPPRLLLSGAEDHRMPPSVQRSNAKHHRSDVVTEVVEFAGRAHLMPSQEGWEEVPTSR